MRNRGGCLQGTCCEDISGSNPNGSRTLALKICWLLRMNLLHVVTKVSTVVQFIFYWYRPNFALGYMGANPIEINEYSQANPGQNYTPETAIYETLQKLFYPFLKAVGFFR